MPRRVHVAPELRFHAASGRFYVTLDGRRHYLGRLPAGASWKKGDPVPRVIQQAYAKAIADFQPETQATGDPVTNIVIDAAVAPVARGVINAVTHDGDQPYPLTAWAGQFQRMQQQSARLNSLGDVSQLQAQYGTLFHPLKGKAQVMLNALRSSDYATSYEQRIETAGATRSEALDALAASVLPLTRQIGTLHKQVGQMEGGEGDEEVKIEALEKQACALRVRSSSYISRGWPG